MPTADTAFHSDEAVRWLRHHWYGLSITIAVIVGAIIRFTYIARFPSNGVTLVSGDGLVYWVDAQRLVDGLGYTSGFGDIGAETAHHPPGWVTVLAGVIAIGFDDVQSAQQFGAVLGLVLIVLVAVIGRHYFGKRTGALAASIAAVYPGFWVIEAQVLAEPLALVMLGLTIIALYRFSEETTVRRAVPVGILFGLASLVRSEQLALMAVVLPVILIRAHGNTRARRVACGAIIVGIVVAVLSPWAIYNSTRFEQPVLLSTNGGGTLLAGNCNTFDGELLGFFDASCNLELGMSAKPVDRSVGDALNRDQALENIADNLPRLPQTVLARLGRTLGVYRTTHTVEAVASWQGIETWPVWAWVVSFWFVFGFAAVGTVSAIRAGTPILLLLAPIAIAFVVAAVFYGEPRYHTVADLSFVVLAAYGVVVSLRQAKTFGGTAR